MRIAPRVVVTAVCAVSIVTSVTPAGADQELFGGSRVVPAEGRAPGASERGSPAVATKEILPLTGRPLPIGRMFDMVVTSDRIYMSGFLDDLVVVTDHEGSVTSTLAVNGPVGLAYRGGTLYVAANTDGRVRRYDASTDPPTFLSASATAGVTHPESLEVAGGRLWYTGDCTYYDTQYGSMDLDGANAGAWEPSAGAGAGCPQFHSSSNAPRFLMLGQLAVYDATDDPPSLRGSLDTVSAYDAAVTPDGDHVLVVPYEGTGLTEYTFPDLTGPTRSWPSSNATSSAMSTTDAGGGLIAVSGNDFHWPTPSLLFFSDDETLPVRSELVFNFDFWHSSSPGIYARGLQYSPDGSTLFVITGTSYEESWFHAFPATAVAAHVEAEAQRRIITFGDPVEVTATLTGGVAGAAVNAYHVSEHGYHTKVGSGSIDVDGVASIDAKPDTNGWLIVGYGGDADWLPAESGWERIEVRVSIAARMLRPDHRDGRYAVFRRGQDVVYLATVRPEKTGFVRIRLEVNVNGDWRRGGGDSFRLKDSRVAIGWPGGVLPPGRYRLTTSRADDDENLGNDSGWTYFRVS